jgi:hypothetical protein
VLDDSRELFLVEPDPVFIAHVHINALLEFRTVRFLQMTQRRSLS